MTITLTTCHLDATTFSNTFQHWKSFCNPDLLPLHPHARMNPVRVPAAFQKKPKPVSSEALPQSDSFKSLKVAPSSTLYPHQELGPYLTIIHRHRGEQDKCPVLWEFCLV